MEARVFRRVRLHDAVNKAVDDMPEGDVIKPFLESHRSEVLGMMLMEYNEAETMEMFRQDGIKQGMKYTILEAVQAGEMGEQYAARQLGVSVQQLRTMVKNYQPKETKATVPVLRNSVLINGATKNHGNIV